MPTVVRKDLDVNHAILTVTIFRDDIKPKIDAELKKYRQKAHIKGFRPGQVPMNYVKQMFGQAIFGETLNEMMSEQLFQYIREAKLNVLGQPIPTEEQERYSFKVDNIAPEFSINYEIGFVPAFEIKGLGKTESFERYAISNLEELTEEDLLAARKAAGKRIEVEDAIEANDIVRIAAKEVDGDYETNITLLLRDISDEALKAELLTKKKGDFVRFDARKAESNLDEKQYRKYFLSIPDGDTRTVGDIFEGPITEVSRVTVAELDDEFFQNYFNGSVSSEAEARAEIAKGIQQFYESRANALIMREMQSRLLKLNPIPLPETFLKRWLSVANEGKYSESDIEKEIGPFLENLRWTCLRDDIIARFGIEVTQEEIEQEYLGRVRQYVRAQLPEPFLRDLARRMMEKTEDVDRTRRELETDKVFEVLRNESVLIDKPISSTDFHTVFEETTQTAQREHAEAGALVEDFA